MPARATPDLDTSRPFTRAAGLAAGISDKALRGPAYRRVLTGVYVDAQVDPTPLTRIRAALLVHPRGAFASHESAARVYGVPLPTGPAEDHISVFEPTDRRRRSGVRTHVVPLGTRVVRYRGLPVSAPEQLVVELAGRLGLVDLVVVGDDLVAKGLLTPERLVAYAERWRSPAAARAAAYVRRDVESPMETRLRMLLVLAGLPEPRVNVVVRHEDGRVRYRLDLAWPELKIAVEYDGRQHRADLDQWDHDQERSEWLDDAGWLHVPVFSRGIYRRPDRTLERVAKALRSRGSRVRVCEEWRAHFPVVR